MINIVAMGLCDNDISVKAQKILSNASCVVAKSAMTHIHTTLEHMHIAYIACDDLYEQAIDFDILNQLIVSRLIQLDKQHGNVALCVVGQGSDDSTVTYMKRNNIKYEIVLGVSIADKLAPWATSAATLHITATDLLNTPFIDCDSIIVKYIDDQLVASEVKLKMLQMFDDDCIAYITDGTTVDKIDLVDLDKQSYSYMTSILVEGKPIADKNVFHYSDLMKLLATLRSPVGCAWDREQTHESISINAIEEAYELQHAISRADVDNIIEELGDMLMQVVFHINIASQEGEFEPYEVYSRLGNKLVSRHPHVFGSAKADSAAQALVNWESIKKKEHNIKSVEDNLSDVPFDMSALLRSAKVQSRASKSGYDFANIDQAKQKVHEETRELFEELQCGDKANIIKEGGDLLFAVVNVLRLCGVNAETALCDSTNKFIDRVSQCQHLLNIRHWQLSSMSQQQFDLLWEEVKSSEKY